MSMTLQLVPELETQVRDAAKRDGIGPNDYVAKVLERHLHKQSVTVSEPEAELLAQINLGLSGQDWRRYYQLREKLEDETLQGDEQPELIRITDRIEIANAKRIEALIKLAALRRTTLDALLDEFGLRPSTNV
jgi:hypothetical protein